MPASATETKPVPWNTALRIASGLVDSYESSETREQREKYDTLRDEYEDATFPDMDRAFSTVSDMKAEDRNEWVTNLAKQVKNWEYTPSTSRDRASDAFTSWNDAQSVAARLLRAVQDGELSDVADELDDELAFTIPPVKELDSEVSAVVDELDDGLSRRNELARWVLDWKEEDWSNSEETYATGSREEQLAANLLDHFVGNGNDALAEIKQEFNEFNFPPTTSLRLHVGNARGRTREDRVKDVAEWISTWDDDPDAYSYGAVYGGRAR